MSVLVVPSSISIHAWCPFDRKLETISVVVSDELEDEVQSRQQKWKGVGRRAFQLICGRRRSNVQRFRRWRRFRKKPQWLLNDGATMSRPAGRKTRGRMVAVLNCVPR